MTLSGGITLIDEGTESTIFFHPLIQRLNHVKQLSFAYLTSPPPPIPECDPLEARTFSWHL